jgi:hypothetical protein
MQTVVTVSRMDMAHKDCSLSAGRRSVDACQNENRKIEDREVRYKLALTTLSSAAWIWFLPPIGMLLGGVALGRARTRTSGGG